MKKKFLVTIKNHQVKNVRLGKIQIGNICVGVSPFNHLATIANFIISMQEIIDSWNYMKKEAFLQFLCYSADYNF